MCASPGQPLDETFHETVYFSGHVQGVGFRYQTLQVAKGFEVTGYVRNLPDGRVVLEAEGGEKEVTAFVAEVEDQLAGYIKHAEKRVGRQKQKFFSFTIR
jgi:acylphosphatase